MNMEMDAMTDPTGFAAMRLYNKEKYNKNNFKTRELKISKPINKENTQMRIALAEAKGKHFDTITDKYVSEGFNEFKLSATSHVDRIYSVIFSQQFHNSYNISIRKFEDNVVTLSEDVPKGISVKIQYSYRVR